MASALGNSSFFALLGSGSSASVPWLHCVISPDTACGTCKEALLDPASRNRRNNPSAILSFVRADGRRVNILLDCGKTFRDTVVRQFPALGIRHLDAVILTHAHADAFLGLDDLRDMSVAGRPLPVYTSQPCFDVVSRAFPYLTTSKPATMGLHVASLDWRTIEPWVPFEVNGVVITPLPLVHGPPDPMLGFEFSAVTAEAAPPASLTSEAPGPPTVDAPAATAEGDEREDRIVYLSDLVALPADVRAFVRSRPVTVLVLDALSYNPYP